MIAFYILIIIAGSTLNGGRAIDTSVKFTDFHQCEEAARSVSALRDVQATCVAMRP